MKTNLSLLCLVCVLFTGCENEPVTFAKLPRPVSVVKLIESDPDRLSRVAGSVASWKVEDLGFEVSGRVEYVIEPGSDFEGRIRNANGQVIDQGKVLAKLDETRYQLRVKAAEADVATVSRQRDATQIEATRVLPARQRAADANLEFAKADFDRNKRLSGRDAVSKSELERAEASRDAAQAEVAQIAASLESKAAEVTSFDAKIEQAKQVLSEAQQDLLDCQLTSPFRGQVAEVHVIPGGLVERGQAVLSVQMMDPIKVEFEVSGENVRTLKYKDELDVVFDRDGSTTTRNAVVYMTDPTADPATRTFTVTLLLENTKVTAPLPDELKNVPLAKTRDVWKVLQSSALRFGEVRCIEENSIQQDDEGSFLWKIVNQGDRSGLRKGAVLNVEKVRVTPGDLRLPFLGLWTFRGVTINEGEVFDLENDRVAGQLILPAKELGAWDGKQILFEQNEWLMRPGDVVNVDLSGPGYSPGFYVPVDLIVDQSGEQFVFAVTADASTGAQATKIAIKSFDGPGTLKRIEANGDQPLEPGMQLISAGVHYIEDNEAVVVAEEVEVRR